MKTVTYLILLFIVTVSIKAQAQYTLEVHGAANIVIYGGTTKISCDSSVKTTCYMIVNSGYNIQLGNDITISYKDQLTNKTAILEGTLIQMDKKNSFSEITILNKVQNLDKVNIQ
ncbi:hypothetical protein [Myroides sp. DW712]|uniref:hypothetical protein n=1 Tax=Myroides sp. DW712 TaxID=3389800 RepID=UPI003978E5A4